MYWTTLQGKLFVICFVINLGLGSTVKVTVELDVPALVDPRDSAALGCRYDLGGEEMYSVKWYKDEQEFFRYTPRQQPHVMEFPVAGVHLVHKERGGGGCDTQHCSVELTGLTTTHSSGVYKCEVSTEAPQFRVGFRASNVTVAAVGREAPRLEGLRAVYGAGDVVAAVCVAAPADPAPRLVFLLNGAEAAAGPQRVLPAPQQPGLLVAQRELRLPAERQLFPPNAGGQMRLVCEARTPGLPAQPLTSSPHTARLQPPPAPQQRNVLHNQKLEWLNGQGQRHQATHWFSCLIVFLLLV